MALNMCEIIYTDMYDYDYDVTVELQKAEAKAVDHLGYDRVQQLMAYWNNELANDEKEHFSRDMDDMDKYLITIWNLMVRIHVDM